jgi:hypothetical protein
MAVSAVFALLFYLGKSVPGTEGTSFEEPIITGTMLILSYIFFAIAVIAALIFPIMNLIKNPSDAKNVLIVIFICVVIIGVNYLLASDEPISFMKADASAATLKWVGAGLTISYILAAIAFMGILFYEIASIFK